MRQRGFASLAIILIILVFAMLTVGGVLYYSAAHHSASALPTSTLIVSNSTTSTASIPDVTSSTVTSSTGTTYLSADGNSYVYSNTTYGVSFSYPASDNFDFGEDTSGLGNDLVQAGDFDGGNFTASSGAIMLSQIGIFPNLYPDSNFGGGLFALLVNPTVANASSCHEFGELDNTVQHPYISSQTIHGITYSEATSQEASMTVSQEFFEFHTFQNNLCYELDLEIAQPEGILPGEFPTEISIDQLESNLLNVLFADVSFFHPQ